MQTLKDIITRYEQENNKSTLVLVIGTDGKSVCRQLNKRASDKFGVDTSYDSYKIKDLGDNSSLWKITIKKTMI